MNVLFTKSELILSKAIRGVTGDNISHCALEFPSLGIVVHSNLLGVNIEWAKYFKKSCTVVITLTKVVPEDDDRVKLDKMLDKYENSFYDVGALLFTGFSLLLRKYLKIPLPKSNLWQSTGMFLCTEWVTEYLEGSENSMITPEQLKDKLLNSNEWKALNEEDSKNEGLS